MSSSEEFEFEKIDLILLRIFCFVACWSFNKTIELLLSGYLFTKKLFNSLLTSSKKNYTKENEVINEFIPEDQIKDLIQEDLPFIKNETLQVSNKTRFDLPPVNLLKIPSNKDKNKLNEDEEDQFAAELDGFADQLAAEIKDELEDHKEEIQKSDKINESNSI